VVKRIEKLKAWRKKSAEEIKVESDIILPKSFLGTLAENPPGSLEELKFIMQESPNRFNTFGDQIYQLIGG
jgi:ribonuclease D